MDNSSDKEMMEGSYVSNTLPSAFQLGARVDLNFNESGKVSNAEVIGILFKEDKVRYDVAIDIKAEGEDNFYTVIEGVSSSFVAPTTPKQS